MELTGIRVLHISKVFNVKSLGEGEIVAFDGQVITIVFDCGETKRLDLKTVIKNGIIKAVDADVQQEIMEYINKPVDPPPGPEPSLPEPGPTPPYTYQQIENMFGISIYPFGKGINPTETRVVLISVVSKKQESFVYHDGWMHNGDYMYSGEGKRGDQTLTKGNREIINAKRFGKTIHLLTKFSSKEYYYQGIFELDSYTYEDQEDENGDIRKEYRFRLRKVEDD